MTCKDCIHYEICQKCSFCDLTEYVEDLKKVCEWFKNKSKYIDLPCKVGDTVYALGYEDDIPVDYSGYIFIMANNDFAFLSPVLNGESNPAEICNEYFKRSLDEEDNSGIIVPITELFLTKAEAEAKLKELNENAE